MRESDRVKLAKRIEALPKYFFVEIDRKMAAKHTAGVDVISFAMSDPDTATPGHVVAALRSAAEDASTH